MGDPFRNVASGAFKRHAGSYAWEVVIGGSASQKIGFWGAAPVMQPAGASQAAVRLGNTDGEIGGLMIGTAYSHAEVLARRFYRVLAVRAECEISRLALRDKCEELADDVRAVAGLIHALRTALVAAGLVKGGA